MPFNTMSCHVNVRKIRQTKCAHLFEQIKKSQQLENPKWWYVFFWFSDCGRRMHTVMNIYIGNLAMADVIIAVFCIPFQFQAALLNRWDLPAFMCKLCPFLQVSQYFIGHLISTFWQWHLLPKLFWPTVRNICNSNWKNYSDLETCRKS